MMPQPQRTVLVITASAEDDAIYQQQLQQDGSVAYDILSDRSGTALSQSARKLDGILLELESPYNRSLQLLRQLKEQTSAPVIVVDSGNTEVAVKAFKSGADDYLVKEQVTPDDLRLAMRTAIENAELKRELQRSQERLGLAMKAASMGSWEWTIQTGQMQWSENMRAIFGLEPGQLDSTFEQFVERLHPEDRDRVLVAIEQAVATGADYSVEFRIVHNGQIRWTLSRGKVFYDQEQRPIRMAGTNVDITDRKQMEEALRESEERYAALAKISPVGIFHTNADGDCLYVNTRWCELAGLSPEEAQGRGWVRAIHPDDRDRVFNEWYQSALLNQPFYSEYRFQTPAGVVSWLIGQATAEKNARGEIIGHIGTVTDITERRQAEFRLQESEKHLQLGMQVSGFALAQIDYTTDMVHLSPEAAVLYGLPADRLVVSREQIHATFHPDDRAQLEQHMQELCDPTGSGWFAQDHRIVHADGAVKWLSVRKQVFFDRSGPAPVPSHAMLAALDITDRKQIEVERSRLLQQEQAARAEAERANRIKDEFLAILSHELRSPLNPILGWSNLLQKRKFDTEKTTKALATIERNAKLQIQLIDDLLDVAKILRDKLAMEMAPVDLSFVIESAIDTVISDVEAKSIQLHSALPQIEHISGDLGRIQQIVSNLLSNAIKFTPKHGRVDILLERVDDQAQITVSDTGKGIRPEFLPHLFESFRQEDTSITRKHGGLGLGLAIVRSLVEAHGGTITANSPGEGQGATFTVCFPLFDRVPQPQHGSQELDLTGIRVLAVDDEPDARELLAMVLTVYGAEVSTVSSAAEVLIALESCQPDILISDIGMPDMDGLSLIQQIRARSPEQGGQIPAIALTAYAREEDYQRAIASGFQQQITKPLEPEQLALAVIALARE